MGCIVGLVVSADLNVFRGFMEGGGGEGGRGRGRGGDTVVIQYNTIQQVEI